VKLRGFVKVPCLKKHFDVIIHYVNFYLDYV
jgi:hypothetical protein